MKMILVLFVSVLSFVPLAQADLLKDIDDLGGNKELFEKAQSLSGETSVKIIQKRIVDRRMRFELAPMYTNYFGGNVFLKSHSAGLDAHFHITPRFSLSANYNYYIRNRYNSGGRAVINSLERVPDVDHPESSILGYLNVYPFFGKLNLFNYVIHFDIYVAPGGGNISTENGSSLAFGGNLGMGIWWSQYLSTRIEYKYLNYDANPLSGINENIHQSGLSVSLGVLL